MHQTHRQVTADASRRVVARERERPAVGALTVRTERRAEVLVLWLSGALAKATSALLNREFDSQASQATHVVVDLTALGFIDSSGLNTLVRTLRRAGENDQRLSFRHGPHAGRRLIELTRGAQLRSREASRGANLRSTRTSSRTPRSALTSITSAPS